MATRSYTRLHQVLRLLWRGCKSHNFPLERNLDYLQQNSQQIPVSKQGFLFFNAHARDDERYHFYLGVYGYKYQRL
jgi:hypothetical protein